MNLVWHKPEETANRLINAARAGKGRLIRDVQLNWKDYYLSNEALRNICDENERISGAFRID